MRGRRRFPQPRRKGPRRKPARAPSPVPADQSAALRDRLLDEIAGLGSADAAASWAHDGLTAKNRRTAADAKAVEEAFERGLAELAREDCGPLPPPVEPESSDLTTTPSSPSSAAPATETAKTEPLPVAPAGSKGRPETGAPVGIDKSRQALAEPHRYRSKEHLRFVAKQACLICGRKHSDPHHLSFMQPRTLGCKVSDEFVVPLCRIHHRAVHRVSDEQAWRAQLAHRLWTSTRLDDGSPSHPPRSEPADPSRASRPDGDRGGEGLTY